MRRVAGSTLTRLLTFTFAKDHEIPIPYLVTNGKRPYNRIIYNDVRAGIIT